MDKEIKDILLKFDEKDRYETPLNFNYKGLKSRVMDLSKKLEDSFKLKFNIDDQVQDASFFCDLIIPNGLITNPKPNLGYSIRISNFGELATVTFEDSYPENVRMIIKEVLARQNFIFIPSDNLEEDYDGSFEKFNGILGGSKPTWWVRYFDYL
jgi:hypothetical protein